MKFYQTNTQYNNVAMHKIKFYEENSPHALPHNHITTFNMAVIDDEMIKRGRPYYQVYPEVFEAVVLVQREMDKSTLQLRDFSCLWQEGFLKA